MRETTERPEGIEAGTARLVGTDKNRIVSEILSLLDDESAYNAMARAHNPFGDGRAADRNAEIVARAHWSRPKGKGQIGREACRERVCQYGSISGVAGVLKKKKEYNKITV